jgi:hypothetical protein
MEQGQTSQAQSIESRPRRRVVPIIDARFQWKYTLLIMALGVGLTAIAGGFLYKANADNTKLLDLNNPALQAQVTRNDQIFLLYVIVLVVLMGVGLGFWGLVGTHRISGPLYIVARYLGVMSGGRYPDMRPLRKHDELHEFFAAFEEAVNTMRNRDMMVLRDVEGALADVKKGLEGDSKAGLEATRKTLQRYKDSLVDSLGTNEGGVRVDAD